MPNWTQITIRMNGINNEDLYDENNNFDFNKLIPEPQTYDECPEKYRNGETAPITKDEDRPWFNWYGWHNDFWGTKWNACDTYIDEDFVDFSTAWSEPIPILNKLAERYPNNGMTIEYEYEEGYIGKYEVKNGLLNQIYDAEIVWEENENGEYDEYVEMDGKRMSKDEFEQMVA